MGELSAGVVSHIAKCLAAVLHVGIPMMIDFMKEERLNQ